MRGSNVELQHVHKMLPKHANTNFPGPMSLRARGSSKYHRNVRFRLQTVARSPGEDFFPHIFVWVLVFVSVSRPLLLPSSSASSATSSSITLSHTTLSHTAHTQTHNIITHNFVTHHWPSFCVAGVTLMALGWVWRHPPSFHVAGMALGDVDVPFAWQAWRLATSTLVLRGRRGACGTELGLVARLGAVSRPWCRGTLRGRRGGVAAWHLATSTFVSRGRRGAWRHQLWFCAAGVALLALGWVWWRAWAPLVARDAVALCVAGVAAWQRGTWRHPPSFHVAGMALGDVDVPFAWQAWRLATSTLVLRGRRGACGTGLGLVARLGAVSRPWRRGTLRGRRGGVAAWHLATSTFVSRGRHGTWRRRRSICVAGVALGDINFGFARQAWRFWHWAGSGGALGRR